MTKTPYYSILLAVLLLACSSRLLAATDSDALSAQASNLKVIELYTSQGCSSCPPADKFLSELALSSSTITLACHVTYWDYLGWKDSFSNPFCDKRQYTYKRYLNTFSSYTPQMVINGRYEGVGSQRLKIKSLLGDAEKDDALLPISIDTTETKLLIDISALDNKRTMELYVLGVGESSVVDIKKGENHNRTIEYHNPVIYSRLISMDTDTKNRLVEDVSDAAGIAHWVVLAQDIRTGGIMAAGKMYPKG